jgi:hypothetical protein
VVVQDEPDCFPFWILAVKHLEELDKIPLPLYL